MEAQYRQPTEIQRQTIGFALHGKDVLGAAKTGSGKTLSFLIPVSTQLCSVSMQYCKLIWMQMQCASIRLLMVCHCLSHILVSFPGIGMFVWTAMDGLGALIISPTRELAYQTFEVLRKVGKNQEFSAGLIIGGKVLYLLSSACICWSLHVGFNTTVGGVSKEMFCDSFRQGKRTPPPQTKLPQLFWRNLFS